MSWNYLQVEIAGRTLHPVCGPGALSRDEAHAVVLRLLLRHAETTSFAEPLVAAWQEGAADDTVYAGSLLWAIYEADDPTAGAHAWVEELAATLRRGGSKVRIAW